jgi:hypothetical protein
LSRHSNQNQGIMKTKVGKLVCMACNSWGWETYEHPLNIETSPWQSRYPILCCSRSFARKIYKELWYLVHWGDHIHSTLWLSAILWRFEYGYFWLGTKRSVWFSIYSEST